MHGSRFLKSARALAAAGAAMALVATALAMAGTSTALGQDTEGCEVTDLGTLGNSAGSVLEAEGRWTTEDCDSRFRVDSDAHTFRFEVAEAGRVRVDLSSSDADPYLYLLAEDGSRLGFNDDGGVSLAARIESDLAPGVYMIEATTTTGRQRGPADFALTVSRVAGCDPIHLGVLEPGTDLTASGFWTRDTCGSRIVVEHPATTYMFNMAETGRVRIDLASEDGDTVLSLASLSDGVIGANDDGGEGRNSRIDKLLAAGLYFIEATTYWERDFHALQADYSLTIHLVDEQAEQQAHKLKIEAVHVPSEVVAGDPFEVNYRVGNLGGELPAGAYARLYVLSRGIYERSPRLREIWQPGASYHTGDETASANSTEIADIAPVEISLDRTGPEAVKVFVLTFNRLGTEIGYRFFSQPLTVLSGPTLGPVEVQVGDETYVVTAEADEDGEVTTSVHPAADPDARVGRQVRLRATYTAGVLTQLLHGVFERPTIAELSEGADPAPVSVANLSSSALLKAFAHQYTAALSESGMTEALAAREAVNPIAIEESILEAAGAASSQYASMAASWRSLLERIEYGAALSYEEALRVQSQVAHAESIVAAAVTAGEVVTAARAADEGWEDPDVRSMMEDKRGCNPGVTALRDALEAAGAADIDELLALDAEVRAVRPVHGLAVDGALCGVQTVDAANSRFLQRLSIRHSPEFREMLGLDTPPSPAPSPEPHRLRIIARLGNDGRLDSGVELASGEQVLRPKSLVHAHAIIGRWQMSGEVEVDGSPIGRIRGRRVAGGRFEMGFVDAEGEAIFPDIPYLPADLPVGVWFRSSEIAVPAAVMTGDDG